MTRPIAFLHIGTKAVNIAEISHWWVADLAFDGPALCISMRNGKQVNFDVKDGGGDGYAAEQLLLATMTKVGRL